MNKRRLKRISGHTDELELGIMELVLDLRHKWNEDDSVLIILSALMSVTSSVLATAPDEIRQKAIMDVQAGIQMYVNGPSESVKH